MGQAATPRSGARLATAGSALFGAAVGCAAWALTAWARAFCDAGYEAGGRLELTVLLPLVVVAEALIAPAAAGIGRRLSARAPGRARVVLPVLLMAVATVGTGWWLFATRGTLDGYPGDSGLCPASNVPPQWPDWLPA